MKSIRDMRIEPAKNGGYTVTHHYQDTPSHSSKEGIHMRYTEPETHVFGKSEDHAMLAHIANHLGIEPHQEMTEKVDGDDN